MQAYSCIFLTDTDEKLRLLSQLEQELAGQIQVVYSSCVDENTEELYLLYHPDIVVLDYERGHHEIAQIISEFEENSPHIRIIAFTDYTRFSFSFSLPRLENVYFLPRPATAAAIAGHVEHIARELQMYRERDFSAAALQTILSDNIPVIRQHYLSMLLRRRMPETENILQKFETLNIHCPGPRYAVVVADVLQDTPVEDFEAVSFLLITTIKSAIMARGYQCYAFFDSAFKINCLVGSDRKDMESEVETILGEVKRHFDRASALRLTAGIGCAAEQSADICLSFREAEAAALQAAKSNEIVLFRHFSSQGRREAVSERELDRILELYAAGRTEEYEREMACCMRSIRAAVQTEEARRFVIRYVIRAVDRAEQWGIRLADLSQVPFLLSRLYAAADMDTIEACGNEFSNLLLSAGKGFRTQEDYLVEQAIRFIDEQLANPALDLERVSSSVDVSKSYFCRLFHKITNQNFSSYVRNRRVERAKELLTSSAMKTYEIAGAVGFTTPKYFSSVFKQVTGVTPSEYQRGQELTE